MIVRKIAVALLTSAIALGCSSTPDWVMKQSAAFDDAGTKALYGVGVAAKSPNVAATRTKAEARARAELGKQIETWATSTTKDFMTEHRDFYADDGEASSQEFFESIAKNVAEATLAGAMIIESYDDEDNGQWYALARMSLDSKLINTYKSKVAEAARKKNPTVLKSKTDEMIKELDEQLANKQAAQ